MLRAPTNNLAAALCYAERFNWVIFPAPPGTKKSHKKAEHSNGQRWGATNKPSVIKRDFRRWPKANLGIPTGAENGFFVLEADTKAGHAVDGIASLRKLERQHGRLPKTLMLDRDGGVRDEHDVVGFIVLRHAVLPGHRNTEHCTELCVRPVTPLGVIGGRYVLIEPEGVTSCKG